MKILKASGENFFRFANVAFELDSRGLVLLQGVNMDDSSALSNGAGKSTLMELVNWVLWGTTARDVSGADVIRPGTKLCKGTVHILDDNCEDNWIISRSRSKTKGEVEIRHLNEDAGIDKTNVFGTEKLAQAFIAKIMGCDAEIFAAAVYAGQGALPNLPTMTDKHIKELIEKAAGAAVLERAYAEANAQLTEGQILLAMKNARMESLKRDVDGLSAQLDMETTYDKRFEDHRLAEISAMLNEIATLEVAKGEWEEKASKSPSPFKLKLLVDTFDLKLADHKRANKAHVDAVVDLNKATGRARDCDNKLAFARERAGELARRLREINLEIASPCTVCGEVVKNEALERKRKTAQADLDEANERIKRAENDLRDADAAVKRAREVESDISSKLVSPTELMAGRLKAADGLSSVVAIHDKLADTQHKIESARAAIVRIEKRENLHAKAIRVFTTRLAEAKNAVDKAASDIEELNEVLLDRADAVAVFSPAGVRAHILDTVTPYLNKRTADYLGVLSDGKIQAIWSTLSRTTKGELRERFAIDVTHADGGPGYKALSGGEQRKVQIATALALQDLVASRAVKPIELWVADEIDTALDANGLERLMMVLQEKAKERGTVVVISHSDLRDWIPNVWTITKTSGISELSV